MLLSVLPPEFGAILPQIVALWCAFRGDRSFGRFYNVSRTDWIFRFTTPLRQNTPQESYHGVFLR